MVKGFQYINKLHVIIYFILSIIMGLMPIVNIIIMQYIIDNMANVLNKTLVIKSIIIWVIFLFSIQITQSAISFFHELIIIKMQKIINLQIYADFINKCDEIEYKYFEKKDIYDKIRLVKNSLNGMHIGLVKSIASLFSLCISIIGVFLIILPAGWHIVTITIITAVPVWLLVFHFNVKQAKGWTETHMKLSKTNYYSDQIKSRKTIKETRIFNTFNFFGLLWEREFDNYNYGLIRMTLTARLGSAISMFLQCLVLGLIIILLLNPLLDSIITIGFFVAVLEGVRSFTGNFTWRFNHAINGLTRNKEIYNAYAQILNHHTKLENGIGKAKLEEVFTNPLLEVKDLWFRYNEEQDYILKGLNLVIHKGEQVAIVGVNGCGKSTFVKLLLGFYKPDKGTIRLNGIDPTCFTREERKMIFAVVFQDFVRYEISLRENLAIPDLNTISNDDYLISSLNAVDGGQILQHVKSLEAILGKKINEGVDISNGQWQKLSLARALMKDYCFTVLDEPTSAMDPLVEVEVFKYFAKLSANKSGVFITHRLGAIQFVDRIFVLDHGMILEEGKHQELMDNNNLYAEMYKMQKQGLNNEY